ncbi:topoisomerase I [Microbacterium mangrovi]|uniref:DNA topoisomerase n=1 Tax=Microbacterium mangrovi TaxID=1348253 RepID=A0A0B1ZZ60_9MICO|nr:DNA topoisomerase IB [Microbacterium mangrovi]KHK96525.1 topoisomerase I [Microbacterium mangrovi]
MARLVRVRPRVDPGYRRVRAGRGFRYLEENGGDVPKTQRRRVRSLAIPPAWQDVWISADERGHIQAVGTDDAGRQQYLYHPRWRAARDRGKFARALALAEALPSARAIVTRDLRRDDPDRDHALAIAFRLLDEGAPRVGSARYLERHGSRGLTTLRRRDAAVDGSVVTLSFPAKSGQRAHIEIDDEDLAAALGLLGAGAPRSPLLWHQDGRRRVALRPAEVNEYVHRLTGGPFTAKDFRTLRGTILAADELSRTGVEQASRARHRAEVAAVRSVAGSLGNTPAVARSSYIDPRVFTRYRQGRLLDRTLSPEHAIRLLLGEA